MRQFQRLDLKRLTFSRGLLIAVGTLLSGAALGWARPPVWVILLVGVTGLLLLLAGLRTLETPSSCGDPEERLRRIAQHAHSLAHNLANFENWWPAVEDEGFDGRLSDGRHTTHALAMQTLLFMFGQFFSAAYTFQVQCPKHGPLECVREVYNALGDNPAGLTDYSLMSSQLHVIGVRSTVGWGTVDARPVQLADFKFDVDNDPRFVEDFKPLRRFLRVAAPDTEARARLGEVEKSVKRVAERLAKKGYRP
jgi:hypothetical protein